MKLVSLVAAAAAVLPGLAFGQIAAAPAAVAPATPADARAAGLSVRDGYARSANPQTAAAFMVVENAGPTDCTLTAASGDVAERIGLHTHEEADGVMRMVEVKEGFALPAGGSHALERGGDHIMLMGLAEPLEKGDSVTLTLDFGTCGTLPVELAVDNARHQGHAAGAAGGHGAAHGGPAAHAH